VQIVRDACTRCIKSGGIGIAAASGAPHEWLNALDCGADGVVVPHIRSAAEARDFACHANYGCGGRNYAGSTRAAG